MTKNDYERAAKVAQRWYGQTKAQKSKWENVVDGFCELFAGDNDQFDEDHFRDTCLPGKINS
jgi:hypothetical protein